MQIMRAKDIQRIIGSYDPKFLKDVNARFKFMTLFYFSYKYWIDKIVQKERKKERKYSWI